MNHLIFFIVFQLSHNSVWVWILTDIFMQKKQKSKLKLEKDWLRLKIHLSEQRSEYYSTISIHDVRASTQGPLVEWLDCQVSRECRYRIHLLYKYLNLQNWTKPSQNALRYKWNSINKHILYYKTNKLQGINNCCLKTFEAHDTGLMDILYTERIRDTANLNFKKRLFTTSK